MSCKKCGGVVKNGRCSNCGVSDRFPPPPSKLNVKLNKGNK